MDGRTGSTQFAAEGKRGETACGRLALIDYNPKSCWNLQPARWKQPVFRRGPFRLGYWSAPATTKCPLHFQD